MKNLLLLFVIFLMTQTIRSQVTYAGQSETVTYEQAEIKPEYLGGYNQFIKFIAENYKTPEVEGLSGVVKIAFVIEINGRVSNIKIIKVRKRSRRGSCACSKKLSDMVARRS